jgi:DNA modification methylase
MPGPSGQRLYEEVKIVGGRTRIIYYGDNLEILRQHIATESVDLVYLDPPFKSQQEYNVLFRTVKGEPAEAQVRAFSDTWKWDRTAKATYDRLMEDPLVPGKVSKMVEAFYRFLEASEMMAYLVMMTPRLLELYRVLKPTGSLYLHCDPAASHYLKIVLDTIFGPTNFRNEIVWKRTIAHSDVKQGSRHFGRIHDIILRYTKSEKFVWTPAYTPYDPDYAESFYKYVEPQTGRRYALDNLAGPKGAAKGNPYYEFLGVKRYWRYSREHMEQLLKQGRIVQTKPGAVPRYKRYLDEMPGLPAQDIWSDIKPISSKERLGYETQKPLALLRRIIQTSSNLGDLVLDPFCGCGTALVAAEELGRSWIGIDITYLAVNVMARRLQDHFPGISFEIKGQPQDEEGARALAERDRFQFQVWALSLVGAQPLDPNRPSADRGIDGYLPFLEGPNKYQRAIVQVKSGRVGVKEVRDLRGTLEREGAPFALLISLEPATRAMQQEAADAGFYQVPATGEQIPRVQILTIRELLQGKRPIIPTTQVSPVPAAPRLKRVGGRQLPFSTQAQRK